MRLPSGQTIASAMGVRVLEDSEIKIGKFTGDPADIKGDVVDQGGAAFAGNCPLWTYVLAETEEVNTKFKTTDGTRPSRPGGLARSAGGSSPRRSWGSSPATAARILNQNPLWKPSYAVDGEFGLRELVKAALEG